jgi:NADH-quinone oxidoreductase subunit H
MRIGSFLVALGFIIGALFSLMAAAYGLGGLVETHLFKGASHLTNVAILMLVMVMVMATLLTLAERKWSAFMQDRIGPNRARFGLPILENLSLGGIPHIAADVLKMLTKEAFRPKGANRFLFNLGPILAFAPTFCLFAVIPAGPTVSVMGHQIMMAPSNPDFGLLFIFAIASLAVYGTSIAGWSSNNKFALLGSVRASSQMISYEVALGLSLVGMMIAFSTVQLAGPTGMAEMQTKYLWAFNVLGVDVGIPAWGIFIQPVGFLIFFAAAFAETKRAPFDAPEGESEIVGYFLEYSGMQFGMFMIAEFVEVVALSGILASIFFGGFSLPFGNEWLSQVSLFAQNPWLYGAVLGTVFWLKVILLCYLQLVVRWTFPRFRYDQIQTLSWKILLPIGLVNLFVSGALILADPSLQLLGLFGFGVLLVIAFLTITPPRQVRAAAQSGGPHADHGQHGQHGQHADHRQHGHTPNAHASH